MQGCAEVSETHNMLESSVAKHDARTIFRLLLSEFSNDVAEGGIGWVNGFRIVFLSCYQAARGALHGFIEKY